ncbi:ATP-binding cassette domain-containing protein [Phytohabitans sp. LJ34]|uniref:ATP-binding cassette domain-containing protein n=1 Tax=Phytohabitans sp. LJ34 TaxID=3452217 RepID=UPI003F8C0E35
MKPVFYGPFARLADFFHGWRDGVAGIPHKPARPTRTATTPHREFLIRMAQDAFQRERVELERDRVTAARRVAAARSRLLRAEEAVATAESELAEASRPLTEAERTARRSAEADHAASIVRRRRERERLRRIQPFVRRRQAAVSERNEAESTLAAAADEAARHLAVRRARVLRIHEHAQRRIAAYRRYLVRSHDEGPWVNGVLGVIDPHIPGWANAGIQPESPQRTNGGKPAGEPEALPATPPTPSVIPLGDTTVFGAEQSPDVVYVDYYYAIPRHFTLRREQDSFVLVNHGTRGPYIDGTEVRKAWLNPGDHFDFGGLRYQISDDGTALETSSIGPYHLVAYNLSAKSGSTVRLNGLSLVQRMNTMLAVLGPSGAGKSSLFAALMKELKISETGALYFGQLNLDTHGDQIRTMLGFVPQDDHMHRTLTVERLLRYSDRLRRPKAAKADRERRIKEVCDKLRIDKQRGQLVATLSGGQRKRVSIALELLAEPNLLLLDEPTSGLDAGMDREIMQQLRAYAEQGERLVIVITHATEHIDRAQQLLVLAREGRVIYSGPPQLSALGKDSYADLMNTLSEEPEPAEIGERAHAYLEGDDVELARTEVERRAAENGQSTTVRRPGVARRLLRFPRQLTVLLQRQVALVVFRGAKKDLPLRFSWRHMAMLAIALLPLLVAAGGAVIASMVAKPSGLGPGPSAPATLSLLITLCMLAGQALTYTDIVAEFHIIKREHRTGTYTMAVLLSKWLVFAAIAVIQAFLMTLVFLVFREGPERSLFLHPDTALFVNLAAVTVAAMTLGMLISVLASKVEQAVVWNTFVAIGQIALNGVTADLSSGSFGGWIAVLLPTRWGLAATASAIDLRSAAPTVPRDALWRHEMGQWVFDLGWLLGLTVLFFALSAFWLRRKLNKPD